MHFRMCDSSERYVRRPVKLSWFLVSVCGFAVWALRDGGATFETDRHLDEEEEDIPQDMSLTEINTVVAITLVLIALTILFETLKHKLESGVSEDFLIVVEKLFGELTVMGFLSLVTFAITPTKMFEELSESIFGDGEELTEYCEFVHYAIFFVMVFFAMHVLVLIHFATQTKREWLDMEQECHVNDEVTSGKSERRPAIAVQRQTPNWYETLINGDSALQDQTIVEQLVYASLRDEFIREREVDPPFSASTNSVSKDFNFARYLGHAQTHLLKHVVEVERETLLLFAVGTVAFSALALVAEGDVSLLTWAWIVIGWGVYLSNFVFERHLLRLRERFVSRRIAVALESYRNSRDPLKSQEETKRSSLINMRYENMSELSNDHGKNDVEDLPLWCDNDFAESERSLLARVLVTRKPNRQNIEYWMESEGPRYYILVLQTNLIFTGIYAGLLALVFLPELYRQHHSFDFSLRCLLATLPIVGNMSNKKNVVAVLSQLCSIGTFRKHPLVSETLREVKMIRVVRTFIVVCKLRRAATQLAQPKRSHQKTKPMAHLASFTSLELEEVGKTFDAIDTDHSCEIDREELASLLIRLGVNQGQEGIQKIVDAIDEDGDGIVQKNEFLTWYFDQAMNDKMDLGQLAQAIFELFDSDGSGRISSNEFKEKLDALSMGFSVIEIGTILRELDRDGDGEVSAHEFAHLLERYCPEELVKANSSFKNSAGDGLMSQSHH